MVQHTVEAKAWYQSKTMWTNIGAIIAAAGAYFVGDVDLGGSISAGVIALLNIVMRFVTKQPIA